MGITAPELVSTVCWTDFPEDVMEGVNWDDHLDAHRAVMRMFPHNLSRTGEDPRASSGILYRRELRVGTRHILVQSDRRPMLIPTEGRVMMVPPSSWIIPAGTPVALRAAVNALVRNRNSSSVVPLDEMENWATNRLSSFLSDVSVWDVAVSVTKAAPEAGRRQHSTPPAIAVALIDATGVISDDTRFEHVRRHGLGRARAYGAGLVTAHSLG